MKICSFTFFVTQQMAANEAVAMNAKEAASQVRTRYQVYTDKNARLFF